MNKQVVIILSIVVVLVVVLAVYFLWQKESFDIEEGTISGTKKKLHGNDIEPNTLLPDEYLLNNMFLKSQNSKYFLNLLNGGLHINAADLDTPGQSFFERSARKSNGRDVINEGAYLRMEKSGDLVLYDSGSRRLWSTKTKVPNSVLVLQDDGNLVIYDYKPVWSQFMQTGSANVLQRN